MKQRITVEQVRELAPYQLEKIRTWWQPKLCDVVLYRERELCCVTNARENDLVLVGHGFYNAFSQKEHAIPLLSVGQMMEFLQQTGIYITTFEDIFGWHVKIGDVKKYSASNLCDALWGAVKEIV